MSTKDLLITPRDKIRKEWGKSDEDVSKDINIIKEWLATQPHLPEIANDNMIEFFLTNCKYSIEKTKRNLDMYYTVRDLLPDIYRLNPNSSPDMEAAYNSADYLPLPKLTRSFQRVCLIKFRGDKVDKADLPKAIANYLSNIYEVRIQEDLAMGDIYIVDYENLTFGVVSKITPIMLKHYAFILEKIQSNRLKALHLLNPPGFIANLMVIFKTFLSKKLKERIITHKTLDDLLKYFPLEDLPSDYGGKEKSVEVLRDLWKKKLLDYKDRFDYLETTKVNENLRPEKLEDDELLGYHGSFKTLNVD